MRTDDVLTQLDASHRRHDDEMRALVDAAGRLAEGAARPGDLDAIAEAIAYLERAAPRHFADEEQSLFPRLIAHDPGLGKQLARIADEHVDHARHHARLRELYDAWDGDVPSAEDAASLLAEARALSSEYASHIAEEDELFASVAELLSTEELAGIAGEMDARRGGGGRGGGGGGGGGRRRGGG